MAQTTKGRLLRQPAYEMAPGIAPGPIPEADPAFRKLAESIRQLQLERLREMTHGQATQLQLDFRTRRERWKALDNDHEDTNTWPEWFIIKLHHVLLQDTVGYLHLAFVAPQSVSAEGLIDRLLWVRSTSDQAFQFNACCEVSGIDADLVRPFILRKFRNHWQEFRNNNNHLRRVAA